MFLSFRSVVTASVLYDSSSVVDIAKIQQRLLNKNSTMGILTHDDDVTLVSGVKNGEELRAFD